MPRETVEAVECAVARNLTDFVDALRKCGADPGPAAIRCGGGVAAFTGHDCPLTTIKGAGPELTNSDLHLAEEFFRSHDAKTVTFELAPWISPAVEQRLHTSGYEVAALEDVVVRQPPFEAPSPTLPVGFVAAEQWPALMLRINAAPDWVPWRALASAAAILPDVVSVIATNSDSTPIACAQLMPVDAVALFANDATHSSARGRGAQKSLIDARLRIAQNRTFEFVAAEVAPASGSERNYLRSGFRVAYTRVSWRKNLQ
jgi:hypothetical protein